MSSASCLLIGAPNMTELILSAGWKYTQKEILRNLYTELNSTYIQNTLYDTLKVVQRFSILIFCQEIEGISSVF